MQYLVAGAARIHALRPPLMPPPLTSPLALKLSPALLSLLAQMTPVGGSKASVLNAAVRHQSHPRTVLSRPLLPGFHAAEQGVSNTTSAKTAVWYDLGGE